LPGMVPVNVTVSGAVPEVGEVVKLAELLGVLG
jgi:hypothetical protein